MRPESESETAATGAGSQTGIGQAGAGTTARSAGAQTGTGQADAGAAGRLAQEETVSDVGQGEAYILNMKRIVENALTFDESLHTTLASNAQRTIQSASDYDAQVRNLSLQALANAVALANRVNNASVDLDTRIKQAAVDNDSRKTDNAETFDKQMDGIAASERERTIRDGDVLDVIREAGLSDNPIYQDIVSAAAAEAAATVMAQQSKAGA